jgi:hypothetical protein
MPQPPPAPGQCGTSHAPLAGQEGSRADPVWAAGTLMAFVRCSPAHEGHDGFRLLRTNSSNSCPQSSQVYS